MKTTVCVSKSDGCEGRQTENVSGKKTVNGEFTTAIFMKEKNIAEERDWEGMDSWSRVYDDHIQKK